MHKMTFYVSFYDYVHTRIFGHFDCEVKLSYELTDISHERFKI